MDPIGSISKAIDLGKKALELSNNLANLELRQIAYDVTEQLLQVKEDCLQLKSDNFDLKEENAKLRAENKRLSAPPEMVKQGGLYYKISEIDAPDKQGYCPNCYEANGKAIGIIRTLGNEQKLCGPRKCPSCKNYY